MGPQVGDRVLWHGREAVVTGYFPSDLPPQHVAVCPCCTCQNESLFAAGWPLVEHPDFGDTQIEPSRFQWDEERGWWTVTTKGGR